MLLGSLLGLLLGACSAASPQAPPLAAALPYPASLDALRRPSEIESFQISLVQPHSQSHTVPQLALRHFNPTIDELAWAIFQVPMPVGSLDSLLAVGTGTLYLLVVDFGSGRWTQVTPLSGGEALIDLSTQSGLISPAGYFYAAVLAPPGSQGGIASSLSSLTLVYDEDHAGNTYFVAPDSKGGNDLSPGSFVLPWATLQKAADSVEPGDTVIVRPGDYTGFWLNRSGTQLAPITFSALDGATVIFDNFQTMDGINIEDYESGIHDVIIEGFTVQGSSRAGIRVVGTAGSPAQRITLRHNTCHSNARWGIFSGHVDYMTVEDNQCSNSQDEHGIYLSNSGDFNIARGNVCYGNAGGGIQFNADASEGGDGIMSEALIENNVCFDNGSKGGAALNMDGLQDSVIRGNLLYGNHAGGITLFSQDGLASTGNRVLCNTIIQADNARWCIRIANASTDNTVLNNILWNRDDFTGAISLDADCLSGFFSDHNLAIGRFTPDDDANVHDLAGWFAATDQDEHSVTMQNDSFFHDLMADDYHVAIGSQADGVGTQHSDNPLRDRDGVLRPDSGSITAGCYEAQ